MSYDFQKYLQLFILLAFWSMEVWCVKRSPFDNSSICCAGGDGCTSKHGQPWAVNKRKGISIQRYSVCVEFLVMRRGLPTFWYTRINRNGIHFCGIILITMLVYLSDRVVTNNRHAMNCTRKAFTVSTLSALVHSTHLSSPQWLCDKQSVVLQSEWELRKLAFNSFPFRMGKSSYVPSYCAPTIRVVSVSWHTDMQRLARKVGRVKHWKLQAGLILQNNRKEGGRLLWKFLMLHWQRRRPTKCAPIGWCAIFPGTQPRGTRIGRVSWGQSFHCWRPGPEVVTEQYWSWVQGSRGCFDPFRYDAYRQSGPLKMLKLQKRRFPTCRFVFLSSWRDTICKKGACGKREALCHHGLLLQVMVRCTRRVQA